jgi:hypothetical protein
MPGKPPRCKFAIPSDNSHSALSVKSIVAQAYSVRSDADEWRGNKTSLTTSELNERLWLACILGDDEVAIQTLRDGAQVL